MNLANEIAREYAKQHRNYERRVKPIFLIALRKNAKAAIDWIDQNGADNVPLDLLVNSSDFINPMITAYGIISPLAAKREWYFQKRVKDDLLDILENVWAEIFREYATTYAYRISNELAETTKEQIRLAISEGYELNLNTNQLASYIRKRVMNEISRVRAVNIARTETTTASNLGKSTAAKSWFDSQGENGYKMWVGREDERERLTHTVLNDTAIPISEEWIVGGQVATYPGDTRLSGKERIQCRCTQMFVSERFYNRNIKK